MLYVAYFFLQLCPFPIYTRSGEVHVQLKLSKETVILDEIQIERVDTFLNYTFTNVLRLQKYLMLFDPNASENSYIIVPVKICKYKCMYSGKQNDVNPKLYLSGEAYKDLKL